MRYHTSCHSRFSKRSGIQEINSSEFQLGASPVHIYDLFLQRTSKAANLAKNLLSIRIATFRIFGAIDTEASPVPLTNTPIGLYVLCFNMASDEAEDNEHLIYSINPNHPANLICTLCQKFYTLGWVYSYRFGPMTCGKTLHMANKASEHR